MLVEDVRRRAAGGSVPVDALASFALGLLWCWFLLAVTARHAPPDLAALYFAGHLWATGRPELLYVVHEHLGSVLTPGAWGPVAAEIGFGGKAVYPFVYPPLWAVLMAPVTRLVSPETFFGLAYLVQGAMIPAGIVLARRLLRLPGPLAFWMLLGFVAVASTQAGLLALFHCQPQIAVGFLILLAFERSAAGRPLAAGAALALAAALKLYPAVFALAWVFGRDRASLRAFLGFGLALGLASLWLAGIEVHREFLSRTAEIGAFVIGSRYNVNLENALVQIFAPGLMRVDPGFPVDAEAVTRIMDYTVPDPAWLRPAVLAALGAGAALLRARGRTGDALWRRRALLPAALILVSLSLPLGWSHQYVVVLMLLPALVPLYGPRAGGAAMLAIILLQGNLVLWHLGRTDLPFMGSIVGSVILYAGLFLAFALAPARWSGEPPPVARSPDR